MTRSLKISIVLSVLFLLLIRLRPVWERHSPGEWYYLFNIGILILFVWIFTKIIIEIVRLIKLRKNLIFKLYYPIIVLVLTLFMGVVNPFGVNLDRLYGKVELKACKEMAHTHATFKLRANGNFDVVWGWADGISFVRETVYKGTYTKNADTIFLDFEISVPDLIPGDTLLLQDNMLHVIRNDDTQLPTFFIIKDVKYKCGS